MKNKCTRYYRVGCDNRHNCLQINMVMTCQIQRHNDKKGTLKTNDIMTDTSTVEAHPGLGIDIFCF